MQCTKYKENTYYFEKIGNEKDTNTELVRGEGVFRREWEGAFMGLGQGGS